MTRYTTNASLGIAALAALLVSGFLWGTSVTERGVEQAIRRNFTAAGKLSQIQVVGEKMRRYEKEMFIYVGVPDKRAGYVKEFETSYVRLLSLMDDTLAPSGTAFTEAERGDLLRWKAAATFYANEFDLLARRAAELSTSGMSPEQRGLLTIEYNDRIKAGKDRFRELLTGTEKLREAKEARAQEIAAELQTLFTRLRLGALVGGLALVGAVLFILRNQRLVEQARQRYRSAVANRA